MFNFHKNQDRTPCLVHTPSKKHQDLQKLRIVQNFQIFMVAIKIQWPSYPVKKIQDGGSNMTDLNCKMQPIFKKLSIKAFFGSLISNFRLGFRD